MVSVRLVVAALATVAAALPSSSSGTQRRQDGNEQCINVIDQFATFARLPCQAISEPLPEGPSCAYCCFPQQNVPTLDKVSFLNCHKAETPEELDRVRECAEAAFDGYICDPEVPQEE